MPLAASNPLLAAFHTVLRREALEDPEHEQTLLRLGAAAEMILDGKSIKRLPADDHDTHEAARPQDGLVDDAANQAREKAIVMRIVAKGKTAVLVLGGDHDLTECIKAYPGWGHVRVTPRGYPE